MRKRIIAGAIALSALFGAGGAAAITAAGTGTPAAAAPAIHYYG